MNTPSGSRHKSGMSWSWRIATVAGIPIYLHGTFLLLIAIVLGSDLLRERNLAAAGAGVLFLLAVFGTVVLHELGHALMARRYGIRTRDITLLMLEPVFQRLEACRCQVLPVLRGGRLVGILTPDNVAEFVMFSSAVRQRAAAVQVPA